MAISEGSVSDVASISDVSSPDSKQPIIEYQQAESSQVSSFPQGGVDTNLTRILTIPRLLNLGLVNPVSHPRPLQEE